MQPSKRLRLSNEGSIELYRSLAENNPGHQGKLVLPGLVAGAARWGTTLKGTSAGSGPGARAGPQSNLHSSTAKVDPGENVRVARKSRAPAFVLADATATGNGLDSTLPTSQRTSVGASSHNHIKVPQVQRRVWVRDDIKHLRQVDVLACTDQDLAVADKSSGVQSAAAVGPIGVSPAQEILAIQRRLQRQGRYVLPSAEQANGNTTATAPRLTFATGPTTSGAGSAAALTQRGGMLAAAPPKVQGAATVMVQAAAAAQVQPLAQLVGAYKRPGPPSRSKGRRVWVRAPDVVAPASRPGPCPAAGSVDAKTAAVAAPGPFASGCTVSALTDVKSCLIATCGVAPLTTLTIGRSTTNPRNIELATGAEIDVQPVAADIDTATTTRDVGFSPAASCEMKPLNVRVQTAPAAVAAAPTAPVQAIPGPVANIVAITGQTKTLRRISLSQTGLMQITVAQAAPRRPAAVKPAALAGAAPPLASRQVGPSSTTGQTPLPYFGQYLRPGRHKLVRKAAVQRSAEVFYRTRSTMVAATMAAVAAPAKVSLQMRSVVVPVTEHAAGLRKSDTRGRSASGSESAGTTGRGDVNCRVGGSSSNSGDGGGDSGPTSTLGGSKGSTQVLAVMNLAIDQAAAMQTGEHVRGAATARAFGPPVWSQQRPRPQLQQQPMASATAIGPAAGAKAPPAARQVLAARQGTALLRRGQLTWRRRLSTNGGPVTGPGSRQVAPAGSGAIAIGATAASTSTVTTTSTARPASSVTSPVTRAGEESPPPPKLQPALVLMRVGRSKLRAVASPAAAAIANAASAAGRAAASVSGLGATRRSLRIRPAELWRSQFPATWPATHAQALAGGLRPSQILRQRPAASSSAAAARPALRSLKLVTVNGQQYYTAGPSGTSGREGVRQLHSLSSVAGKAAAAAAAAAAAKRQAPATAVTTRAAMASRAVRLAVWRRRGLDPISPTRFANAIVGMTSERQDGQLSTPRRPAAVLVAAGAGARHKMGRVTAAMTPSPCARKLGDGISSVRAMAAQRILAKARMRRAAAQAIKARGYCPDYCRTGVCSLSRDISSGRCPHTHDPSKVAVCSRWLAGSCTDASCHLQHRRVPDLMPLCTYFLQVR
ncbi:hypothetical protein Vretimale_2965 [Volvox reticuliferus]|uniref:C3H1-type domain-containing protein n=1 Tax=Volvox reticuliferus TaxID=1737510 RepID=A0A8J4G382_9CHLO|nr:hypothetical protein Vretifemale_6918 [Volvox reticuliferus]GIL97235.1 hypothetical protein Vretimale_2965 [Volvox reticuliferus]